MRLIDADAVFELFKPFKDALDDEKVKSAYIQTLTLIHNAPSKERAVSDLIRRSDAIKVIDRMKHRLIGNGCTYEFIRQMIEELPTIEPKRGKPDFADCEKCSRTYGTLGCCSTVSNEWVYSCLEGMLEKAYTDGIKSVEPKRGEWEEKETFHNGDDEPIIEEWQSALCSVCHKYHTTPYMYYFKEYNFCPNCGADMRGKGDE